MAIARHDGGVSAAMAALLSQVHPVFMLPPVATAAFGAILAVEVSSAVLAFHLTAVFFAVYTAHVKDGYVDFHVRGEDDDHPLTASGCRKALVGAGLGFACCLAGLWLLAGWTAVLVAAPLWVIGFLHAPQLDTRPVTTTLGYPVGVGLALFGGYYVQTRSIAPIPVAFATIFVTLLAGVKIIDDATDYDYDRGIDKRTVAVVLGRSRSRTVAYLLIGGSLVAVLWATIGGLFPAFSLVAVAVLAAIVVTTRRLSPKYATMVLVRGVYVFLALLVVAVWFTPLSSISLPDIGILGPYTYLATEIVFGGAALVLLLRAGRASLWSAARTIAVLYPIAYLWDWYTLEVGVFEVVLRTGISFAGIPLEEHLFAVVVPALVLGIHETFNTARD
ncbi:UbiA family prenyltransferase [Haloferax namakaokahaiae]|uniref:UbiA family prenyltransferase n=1 Tax=Haloferax namakaokahaiae TaxID=1748331 RepID=A0ABD5ZEA7_9EURY